MKKIIIHFLMAIVLCTSLLFLFKNQSSEIQSTTKASNVGKISSNISNASNINNSINDSTPIPTSQDNKNNIKSHLVLNSFYDGTNFHTFVNDNLQKAIDGDRTAQYYLSQALAECEHWVSHPSFQSDELFEKYLNEDKIYLEARNSQEVLKDTYKSCKSFVGENMNQLYGTSDEWLKKSLDSNFPSAVVESNITNYFCHKLKEIKK